MKNSNHLVLLVFGGLMVFNSCGKEGRTGLAYPEIELRGNTTSQFGNTITDDYQNLNHLEDEQIKKWFKDQDSLAEKYFSNNPFMELYLERFQKLQKNQEGNISMVRINEVGNYFYLKHDEVAGVDKLYFRKALLEEEEELFDPGKYLKEEVDITYIKPSFDGSKVAIGYQQNNFSSKILLIDVATKKLLPEIISNVNPDFGGIEWLPDNSGFIYLYFPVIENAEEGYKKNSFSVIHRLGDDPDKLVPIFGNSNSVPIPQDFYPKVKIGSSEDKYIIGYSANSGDFYDGYIATVSDVLSGKPNWIPFFKEEQKVYFDQGKLRGEEFIFRQGSDNGNKISKVKLGSADFDNPLVLAEGSKENPIVEFEVSRNKIFFAKSKFGVEISLYEISEGYEIEKLETPFKAGFVSFFGASVLHNSIGVELDGWTSDYTRFLYSEGTFRKEGLKSVNEYPEFENLVSEQIMVISHDGEEVPLSLVYNKNLKPGEHREVFIYVYGAYGESLSPFFYPIFLDWAEQGGILAFPHVRGGGEKGKYWHIQGRKNLKFNSWKDLIACTEELIRKGYTKKGFISLYTSSAGGITAGMAVNDRPDLFSSFIAEVPRLNPFGLESSSTASSTSYLEYGTVKDSVEFQGLVNMDPYLNLKPATDYPATLIMPSYNDDRIPMWDSGKYIAKLQRYNTASTPVIMDVDYDSGHNSYQGYDETVKLYSKIFSFAKANMQKQN